MKINTSNTALGLLEHMDPFEFRMCDDGGNTSTEKKQRIGLGLVKYWPQIVGMFKNKVQYISDPFYEAYEKAYDKIREVATNEPFTASGTFVSRASPSETNTIFYSIESKGRLVEGRWDVKGTIIFFTKQTSRDKPALAMMVIRDGEHDYTYMSRTAQKNELTPGSVIVDICTLIMFMKYCEMETKIIPGGRREHHAGVKYVNETKQKIEILDSTWFTTIVRSEGFDVRGHFRWQPYSTGKKLIWIEKFEKHGYTRRAKIDNSATGV